MRKSNCTVHNPIFMKYSVTAGLHNGVGRIDLAGSKSISNRALIIQALTKEPFQIERLANANDTELLERLLHSGEEVRDTGPAGTTFRFLTAYLSLQPGTQVLTGSDRMKQRPIGVLVEALRQLGADIQYLEREGYPPLRIGEVDSLNGADHLSISASTSSQYISALLMIAPVLPNGLKLELEGKIVSRPYIEMTLSLMQHFGVEHQWDGNVIRVPSQQYQARAFTVEADWSAASYYYSIAAIADGPDLYIDGLFEDSVQGDSVLARMMTHFGVRTEFTLTGVRLTKDVRAELSDFTWDFIRCPDLAQTLAVCCGALGVEGYFSGLETLRIKETDRIAALQAELAKVGVTIEVDPADEDAIKVRKKADLLNYHPTFDTYEDHRMAMAFAPLAMLGRIEVDEPMVVIKSYPDFWKDLQALGFEVFG